MFSYDVAHGHDELHHDAEDRGRHGCIQAVGDEHAEPRPEQKAQRPEDEEGDEQRSEQREDGDGDLGEQDVAVADEDGEEGEQGGGRQGWAAAAAGCRR